MKKIVLGIVLLLCTNLVFPQYITITPTYTSTPKSYWALISALEREARAKKEAEEYRKAEAKNDVLRAIGNMKQYITDALGQNIDETLRKELNEDYEALNKIAKNIRNYGLQNDLIDELQRVSDDITDNILSYNNRIAEAQRAFEVAQREAEQHPQEWSGSGFALNNGYVVTNYHVVEEAKSICISGVDGDFGISYTAMVVATDKVNDLAIIKISDKKFKGFGIVPYAIDMIIAEVGDDVFVLGYPLTQTMGDEIKLTNGIISSRTGFQGDVSLYQMSAPIQPGSSGGPMFNSKGNVVGIVCAHHKGTENVGYAIKTSYLKNLAESSSLSNIFPTNNTVGSLSLSGQVKKLKKYVYLIKCSNRAIVLAQTEPSQRNINSNQSGTITRKPSSAIPSNNSNQSDIANRPVANSSSKGRLIYYPFIEKKETDDLIITQIHITDSNTAINIRSRFTNYAWCSIAADTYISANGLQLKLTRAEGINISPQVTYYNDKDVTFTLYFPSLPTTTTQIDLIEPGTSDWKLYGIKLQ